MNERDFFEGMKNDGDQDAELVAGAEHFVRLKKQTGQFENEEPQLEKEAATLAGFTNLGPHAVAKLKEALKEKEQEKKAGLGAMMTRVLGKPAMAAGAAGTATKVLSAAKPAASATKVLGAAGHAAPIAAPGSSAAGVHPNIQRVTQGLKPTPFTPGPAHLNQPAPQQAMGTAPTQFAGGTAPGTGRTIAPVTFKPATPQSRLAVQQSAAAMGQHVDPFSGASFKIKQAAALLRYRLQKMASVPWKDVVRDPAALLVGGTIGAGTGLLSYLNSRPKDELKGKSEDEVRLEGKVKANKERGEEHAGLVRKLRNRMTEMEAGSAKAFREHPLKASLLGGVLGTGAGLGIARMLGAGGK